MAQRRICERLGLSCTHNQSFLCLPPAVQHQIYGEAGLELVTDRGIDLNRNRRLHPASCSSTPDCEFPLILLLSCRTLYYELSTILYTSNRFFIRFMLPSPPNASAGCHPHRYSLYVGRYEKMRKIFFTRNRFIVAPSKGCNYAPENTPGRLEASIFLRDVVPYLALRFLRFLEVVFPPFDDHYLRPQEPSYQDWLEMIDYVKNELTLPRLTLRVYMADHHPSGQGVTPFCQKITKEQGTTILKTYIRILSLLSTLGGLNKFFAHLA
jgi:hypothetical protein